MQTQTQTSAQFHQTEKMLTNIIYDREEERIILNHWRTYEPQRVAELASHQMLRKALIQKADDLLDLQISLEKTEHLPPSLAKMEAWRILMKPTTTDREADEEEEIYGEMDM